jgi:hypothetical protein
VLVAALNEKRNFYNAWHTCFDLILVFLPLDLIVTHLAQGNRDGIVSWASP